jgi:uncharacterized repeat protein (TIGR03803 family)
MDRWSCNASIQVGDATYGTRLSDPPAGCVFRTEKDGRGYTALHIFGGKRGYGPDGLVAVDGVLYGVTTWGGPDYLSRPGGSSPGLGVLYRLNLDGSGFEIVHNFTRSDGPSPRGAMAYLGGMLYGTTAETLFRTRPDGSRFTVLHTFGAGDGAHAKVGDFAPGGGLIVSSGILYGTTFTGGDDRLGTIFSFDVLLGRFQTLHAFKGPEGSRPQGALVLHNGMLHGVTEAGGRHDAGIVFQLPVFGGAIKTLVEFERTDAAYPSAGLALGLDGALYGNPNPFGPRGDDVVFRLAGL